MGKLNLRRLMSKDFELDRAQYEVALEMVRRRMAANGQGIVRRDNVIAVGRAQKALRKRRERIVEGRYFWAPPCDAPPAA